jgi:hypothetical protein
LKHVKEFLKSRQEHADAVFELGEIGVSAGRWVDRLRFEVEVTAGEQGSVTFFTEADINGDLGRGLLCDGVS